MNENLRIVCVCQNWLLKIIRFFFVFRVARETLSQKTSIFEYIIQIKPLKIHCHRKRDAQSKFNWRKRIYCVLENQTLRVKIIFFLIRNLKTDIKYNCHLVICDNITTYVW